jgi:hypothetical protein
MNHASRTLSFATLVGGFLVACSGGSTSNTSSNTSTLDGGADGRSTTPRGDGGTTDAATDTGGTGCGTSGCGVPDAGVHPDGSASDAPPPPALDAGASAVTFTVDVARGPNRVYTPPATPAPVSPYVYGVNSFAAWQQTTKWGMLRWGGDGQTDYNWTNNYSNAGSDFCFSQINEGGGATLAGKFTGGTPSVVTQQALGGASLVTVPILDYVASSAVTNNVWSGSNPPCPGTPSCGSGSPNPYADNVAGLSFETANPSSSAFVKNHATKGSALCTATSGACAVSTTGPVYQDEFVNFMKTTYSGSAQVFFMLDNEPNYWPVIHPEIYPSTGTPGCGTSGTVTFDEVVSRNTTFATAVKGAWPGAKVFGPVIAQDGILYAGDYSDPNLPTPFGQYYLAKMAAASVSAGHALIDSFDTHYYTNHSMTGSGDPSAAQCLAAPRLFWDPNFTDYTAAQVGAIDFGYSNALIESALYPRQMIPRMLGWIANAYAGHTDLAPGFSISEYDIGCEGQVEGGVAEADLLGIFGREGLFAATMWPLTTVANGTTLVNYPVAAFDLYRNYDGHGAVVGDTTVYASTSDVKDTSVYAFTSSTDANEVDLVLVNKLPTATPASITIAHAPSLTSAAAFQLATGTVGVTSVSAAPAPQCTAGGCSVVVMMPPTSATTLVLK